MDACVTWGPFVPNIRTRLFGTSLANVSSVMRFGPSWGSRKGIVRPTCMKAKGAGDVWTWVALDADTKLVPCWFIGNRDADAAFHFMNDLAGTPCASRPGNHGRPLPLFLPSSMMRLAMRLIMHGS